MAEKRQDVRLQWGVAKHSQGQEAECGDAFTIQPTAAGFLVAVIDGLGHGPEAARAAERAVDAINQTAEQPLQDIMRACHRGLLSSRGAAISVAQIDLAEQRLSWLGVGNVEGVVLSPITHQDSSWRTESLVVRGGVVGYEMPNLQTGHVTFGLGSILVFATDGIKEGFSSSIRAGTDPQWTADQIMGGFDRGTDDALVLVVRHVWGGSDHAA
jgi:serine/threonine protein phosphatase PrpC